MTEVSVGYSRGGEKTLIRGRLPLKASTNPYLSGYLTVKWTWHAAANQRSELANCDAFLVFLRHYIFCDLELVRLLLEATVEEFDQHFAPRIRARLDQLRHDVGQLRLKSASELLDLLDRYEWGVEAPPDVGLVGMSLAARDRGQQAIKSSITELERRANDNNGNHLIWTSVVEILNERDAFVLDRCDVDIDITGNGIARVNYSPISGLFFAAGQCQNHRLWGTKGIGYATMFVSRRTGRPYFSVCYADDVLFELMDATSVSSAEKQRIRDIALGIGRTASLMGQWHDYLRQWVLNVKQSAEGSLTGGRSGLSTSFFNIREVIDRLYGSLSMPPSLTEKEIEVALARLEMNGIARMFPANRIRLLPVMVGWSLGGAQSNHLDALLERAGKDESLLDMIMDVNAEALSCWGADLFVMEDDELHSLTI